MEEKERETCCITGIGYTMRLRGSVVAIKLHCNIDSKFGFSLNFSFFGLMDRRMDGCMEESVVFI